MRVWMYLLGCTAALAVGCGGGSPPPASPEPPAPAPEPPALPTASPEAGAPAPEMDAGAQSDAGSASSGDAGSSKETQAEVEPKFTPGMSVDQAISAVPMGADRINVDEDSLAKPLKDFKVYKPCRPSGSQHFSVRVAVWNGKAVGVDVTTKPKNKRLAACIDKRVRKLSWKDGVPSLNTVEYSF